MLEMLGKKNMIKSVNSVSIKNQNMKIIMSCDVVSYGRYKNSKIEVIAGEIDSMFVAILPEKDPYGVIIMAYGKKNKNINKESYDDMDETLIRCSQDVATKIVRTLYNPDIKLNKDRIDRVVKYIKERIGVVLEVKGMYYPVNMFDCDITEVCNQYFNTSILNKLFELE